MENLDSFIIPLKLNYFYVQQIILHTERVFPLLYQLPTCQPCEISEYSLICSTAVEGKVKCPTISQSAFMTDDLLGCYWAYCHLCRVSAQKY